MSYNVSFPGLGIHDLFVRREAFYIGNFPVYWYGLIISFALLLCFFLAQKESAKYGIVKDDLIDGFLISLPLAFLGARIYYIIFSFADYADNLWKIFDLRSGGLAFYGGLLGAFLGIIITAKIKNINKFLIMDFIIVYIPLGQAIGRWGNFVNQEAFGTNTTLPWGMISEGTKKYLASLDPQVFPNIVVDMPVHPTFFYEFLGNLVIFALLIFYRKRVSHHLQVFSLYLLSYGLLRFVVEGLRTDPLFFFNTGLRVSQVLSLLMIVVGLAYLLVTSYRKIEKLYITSLEINEVKTQQEQLND